MAWGHLSKCRGTGLGSPNTLGKVGEDAEPVSPPTTAAAPHLGCVSRGMGHWLDWGAMRCEGSLGLWDAGGYTVGCITEPQGMWGTAGYVGCCGPLWGVRMGGVGCCIVCHRIYGALVLCREGHAGGSVIPLQPFG